LRASVKVYAPISFFKLLLPLRTVECEVLLISIAIPDSLFTAEDSLREKTIKSGEIARAAAIFGVERIYIYRDASRNYDDDFETARMILDYAETPQYLRKRLIRRKKELEFAGLLPPLRTPHHAVQAAPRVGEIRESVLLLQNGQLVADVGAKEMAKFEGRGHEGQRITVRVESLVPLLVRSTERPRDLYWGYEVRRAPSFAKFLRSVNFDMTVLTSRLGEQIQNCWSEFVGSAKTAEKLLICFGSPAAGIDRMLTQDNAKVRDFPKAQYLNFFPFQNVETVRLEEAILGVLSIVNLALHL
jgi:methyltransferase